MDNKLYFRLLGLVICQILFLSEYSAEILMCVIRLFAMVYVVEYRAGEV